MARIVRAGVMDLILRATQQQDGDPTGGLFFWSNHDIDIPTYGGSYPLPFSGGGSFGGGRQDGI